MRMLNYALQEKFIYLVEMYMMKLDYIAEMVVNFCFITIFKIVLISAFEFGIRKPCFHCWKSFHFDRCHFLLFS